MLVEKLEKEGYEAAYVRPIFVLLNILTPSRGIDITLISPRRMRILSMNNLNKSLKKSFPARILMALVGYLYALATYVYIKHLCRDKVIVCDRYFYQFFFDSFGKSCENIIKIFPKPDIAFFLDGDLDLLYSRMSNSFDTPVIEHYYASVLDFYRRIYQKQGIFRIDANLGKYIINDKIFSYLQHHLDLKSCRMRK